MDELELARRDRNYEEINKIVKSLSNLTVFPSLAWVYTWDIVKDKLDYYNPELQDEYITNSELTEKDVWDLFWEDADKNGFSLEYGTEDLHEAIFDWMLDRNIIVALDDDGWLDDEENEGEDE